MVLRSSFLALASILTLAGAVRAGEIIAPAKEEIPMEQPKAWTFTSDVNARISFAAGGSTDKKSINELEANAQYVLTSQYNEGAPIRVGLGWQRFSFSNTADTRVPNTLQAQYLILGVDAQFFDNLFVRLEAQPGFYSGHSQITQNSFNVPVVLGASYLWNKNLQLIVGVSFDPTRVVPFLPGLGVRWQVSDQWVLNIVAPRPRIEYKPSEELTLYFGGEFTGGTFRVDSKFGDRVGHDELDHAWVSYTEFRVGGGAVIKKGAFSLELEAGYLPYRDFNFYKAEISAHTDNGDGAFYGGVSLSTRF